MNEIRLLDFDIDLLNVKVKGKQITNSFFVVVVVVV